MRPDLLRLASQLLERIEDDRAPLARDPLAELPSRMGVQVRLRPVAARDGLCPVDGAYVPGPPATIFIGQSASPGRQRFTAAHELGHHLLEREVDLALQVAELPDRGRVDVIEQVCNAFAAELLMPAASVPADVTASGPHPQDIVDYANAQQVSRSAAAARLAPCLPGPGWILVISDDGRVLGSAAHGDVPTVAFGTPTPFADVTSRAHEHGRATGSPRATFVTGTRSASEYHAAAVRDRSVVVVVATRGRAPWVKLHILREQAPQGTPTTCVRCDEDFEGMGRPCPRCGDFVHRRGCGKCSCGTEAPDEVRCSTCLMMKNIDIVTDGVCRDCR